MPGLRQHIDLQSRAQPAAKIWRAFVRDENSELAAGAKNGMDPNMVGDLIVEAILENKLYVMAHDEERHMVEIRHANIMVAFDEAGLRKT